MRVNSDQTFCEEYWCITTWPRVEGMSLRTAFDAESITFKDELKSIKYKFLNGAIRVVPAIPDIFFGSITTPLYRQSLLLHTLEFYRLCALQVLRCVQRGAMMMEIR